MPASSRSVSNTSWWTIADANIAQLELLHLLNVIDRRNIVVVGDNDEAIYRFARIVRQLQATPAASPMQEGQDSSPFRVALMDNYRSTANILRVATQAISMVEVSRKFPKKVLQSNKPEERKTRIVELDDRGRSRLGRRRVQRLHAAGRRRKDSRCSTARTPIETICRRTLPAQDPFVISKLSILEHPLVRDVLAFLHLIAEPFDDIACARVLWAPAWHPSAADLVRLAERAGRSALSRSTMFCNRRKQIRLSILAHRDCQAPRISCRTAQTSGVGTARDILWPSARTAGTIRAPAKRPDTRQRTRAVL